MPCHRARLLIRTRMALVATVVCAVATACVGTGSTSVTSDASEVEVVADATTTTEAPATTTTTAAPRPPAESLRLTKLRTVSGDISPKSVVASGHGVVTAQNMMYTHTVTAYDSDGELIATVPDSVRLTDFGIDEPGEFQGAPVEAAFTPDGEAVYVSNYSMYGPGYSEGSDQCSPGDGTTSSFLYRISTESWEIDQVIPAGAVPKYVAVTPDGETVVASTGAPGT